MLKLKKADIVLIAAVATVSAALVLYGFIMRGAAVSALIPGNGDNTATEGNVEVLANGAVIGTYDLSQDGVYKIVTEYGRNVLEISGGTAKIREADCVGGDCVRMREISAKGEVIVCLPHHLVVRVISGAESGIDVVVR